MDGVELLDRRFVGLVVRLGGQLALPDVHDEEGGVEAALLHLRQIDLRIEPLRVVLFAREVLGVDVVVRVERDDALVDGSGFRDERGVSPLRLALSLTHVRAQKSIPRTRTSTPTIAIARAAGPATRIRIQLITALLQF